MAEQDPLITASDLSKWGSIAMFAGGVALLSGVLALVLPSGITGFLHNGRSDNVSTAQLLEQIQELRVQQNRLIQQNEEIRNVARRLEVERVAVAERIGALETAIPMLLEVVPPDADIDRTLTTASIGNAPEVTSFETEGGSVSLTTRPLFPAAEEPDQPLPSQMQAIVNTVSPNLSSIAPDSQAENSSQNQPNVPNQGTRVVAVDFGVALGDALGDLDTITEEQARGAWQDVLNKAGALLIGVTPALSDPTSEGEARLVAGPIIDYAGAEMLCARIVLLGINCVPVQYDFSEDDVIAMR